MLLAKSVEQALFATVAGGGDTDTNACIVGGLVGALFGYHSIPEHARRAVEECNTDSGRPRPPWMHPKVAKQLVATLLARSPASILPAPSSYGASLLNNFFVNLAPQDLSCEDNDNDSVFYAEPRFDHYVSSGARDSITQYLRLKLVSGWRVLDLVLMGFPLPTRIVHCWIWDWFE